MTALSVTPYAVRSLFRGHWAGERAALSVLAAPALQAAFRAEVQRGPQARVLRAADPDPDDHVHAGMLDTLTYAAGHRGLAVPDGFWTRGDARPMLVKVFRDRLVDRHRRRWRESADVDALEGAAAPEPGPVRALDPARLAEYRARMAAGSLRLGMALAFGAEHDGELVVEVARMLDGGHPVDPAFARSGAETAELLYEWAERVPEGPAPCRARRALAWIVRGQGREGPAAWQAADPGGTTRAMDLLLKWQHRAEAALPARLLRERGPRAFWGCVAGKRRRPGRPVALRSAHVSHLPWRVACVGGGGQLRRHHPAPPAFRSGARALHARSAAVRGRRSAGRGVRTHAR